MLFLICKKAPNVIKYMLGMSSGKKKNSILTYIKKNYVISYDQKKEMVDKNLSLLQLLMLFCLTFGFLTETTQILVAFNHIDIISEYYVKILYYAGWIFLPLVVEFWVLIVKNHKTWNPVRRSLPIYFAFCCFLCLVFFIFYKTKATTNTFIIFASITAASPILLNIAPIFYIPTIIILASFLSGPIFIDFGLATILDLWVYTFIMIGLCLYKWRKEKETWESSLAEKLHTEQIDKELELASFVQQSFYNHSDLKVKDWEISYYTKPMNNVTGDIFDFYHSEDTLQGFSVFDVSGHGLSAGLVTMLVRSIIHRQFVNHYEENLDDIMYRINNRYNTQRGKIENYMSGILCRIVNDEIEMVNGAHPYPFLYKKSEKTVKLYEDEYSTRGTAIGLGSIEPYFATDYIKMETGDEIILYTDGITEAMNDSHAEYGIKRFQQVLQENINKSTADQLSAVIDDLRRFVGTEQQSDDITLLILKRK